MAFTEQTSPDVLMNVGLPKYIACGIWSGGVSIGAKFSLFRKAVSRINIQGINQSAGVMLRTGL